MRCSNPSMDMSHDQSIGGLTTATCELVQLSLLEVLPPANKLHNKSVGGETASHYLCVEILGYGVATNRLLVRLVLWRQLKATNGLVEVCVCVRGRALTHRLHNLLYKMFGLKPTCVCRLFYGSPIQTNYTDPSFLHRTGMASSISWKITIIGSLIAKSVNVLFNDLMRPWYTSNGIASQKLTEVFS
jgi:hypothetical protein